MVVRVSIDVREIPPDSDPVLDIVPLLQRAGYRLVGNGVGAGSRFLEFAFPDCQSIERTAAE